MNVTYKRSGMLLWGIAAAIGILLRTQVVYAEEADLHYGSEWYEAEAEGNFPIALYIESESEIGTYAIILTYDPDYLAFIDGAEPVEDGRLMISGDLQGQSARFMMHFRTLMEGETSIDVESAAVISADGTEDFEIEVMPSAPILITPHVTPPYTGITVNGTAISGFSPRKQTYEMTTDYVDWFDTVVEGAVTTDLTIEETDELTRILHISATDEAGTVTPYQVRVHMTARPEGNETDSGNEEEGNLGGAGAEDAAQPNESENPAENLIEDPGNDPQQAETEDENPITVSRGDMVSDDELQEIIRDNRRESMLKAGVLLLGMVIVLSAVVMVPAILNRKVFEKDDISEDRADEYVRQNEDEKSEENEQDEEKPVTEEGTE